MSNPRRKKKVDGNQNKIIEDLEKAGYSVEKDHDDIIVGRENVTLWVEVKNVDCYSKRTGLLRESAKTPSQKKLDKTYTGARIYAKCSAEIIGWFRDKLSRSVGD